MNERARRCVFCTVSKQIGLPHFVFHVKTYIVLIQYLYGFLICLRLINVLEHIKTLAEKVLKIGEYSRNNQQSYGGAFLISFE